MSLRPDALRAGERSWKTPVPPRPARTRMRLPGVWTNGLTLVEVLLALSLLTAALLGVFALFAYALRQGERTETQLVASWLAQGALEEWLDARPRLPVSGTLPRETGEFPPPHKRYHFTITPAPVSGEPRLTRGVVTVTGPQGVTVTLEGVRLTTQRAVP